VLNIPPDGPRVKPDAISASIDTLELWFPDNLPPHVYRRVVKLLPRLRIKRTRYGIKAGINRPTLAENEILGDLWNRDVGGCRTHRVHMAFDFIFSDRSSAMQFKDWLPTRCIFKWSPNHALEIEDGYYVRNFAAKRRPGRAPVIYLKGDNTVRVELRFENAEACRRAGLDDPLLIIDLDPSELFRRCAKVVNYRSSYLEKVAREVEATYGEEWVRPALYRLDKHCALMMRAVHRPEGAYTNITDSLGLPRTLKWA
jgi:hypothetical protein